MGHDKIELSISEQGRNVQLTVNNQRVAVRRCVVAFEVERPPIVTLDFVWPSIELDGSFTAEVTIQTAELPK